MRRLLNHTHLTYNSKKFPIYITENGISSAGNGTDLDPELDDAWRINFYHGYIGQLHRAITEDNVNVKAYTAWSLMDNFEWSQGYTQRFGMMWVNFTDPHRAVYHKRSAEWYAKTAELNYVFPSN